MFAYLYFGWPYKWKPTSRKTYLMVPDDYCRSTLLPAPAFSKMINRTVASTGLPSISHRRSTGPASVALNSPTRANPLRRSIPYSPTKGSKRATRSSGFGRAAIRKPLKFLLSCEASASKWFSHITLSGQQSSSYLKTRWRGVRLWYRPIPINN